MKFYLLCFLLYLLSPELVFGKSVCSKNGDCPVSASCQSGLCICDAGKIINSEGNKCLDMSPGIGSPCIESTQCTTLISGPAICNEKELCSCGSDHVYFNNKCVKYLGLNESCTADTPCFDGVDLFAMTCGANNKCGCSDGYYLRGDVDCRKSAKDDGECLLDLDCENENQYCKFKYGPLGNCMDAPNIACRNNDECQEKINNTFCADFRQNKCTCMDDLIYDIENNECIPETSETPKLAEPEEKYIFELKMMEHLGLENPCTDDTECKEIQNSFCAKFRNKCTCLDSFIYDKNSGNCVRGVGATCFNTTEIENSTECGVKHSFCNKENNICQCPKYFVYSPYTDKCFKPTREFNRHSCGSDENCFSFGPYATCTKDSSADATTTCKCNSNAKFDEELKYCKLTTTASGCKNECKDKLHSKCNNGECVCEDNYIEENLKCYPDLGYPCSIAQNDCIIENAVCVESTKLCQCQEGYFKNDKRECLKDIEEVDPDDKCQSDHQCIKLLDEGGICFNGTCICSSKHIYDDESKKCELLRSFGDQCTSKRDCQTMLNSKNIICLNGACVCEYEYHLSDDKTQCVADNGASALDGRQLIFFVVLVVTTLLLFL